MLAAHAGGRRRDRARALSSVSVQQLEAARALNFSRFQTLFRILAAAAIEMMPGLRQSGDRDPQALLARVAAYRLPISLFAAQSIRNITPDSASIYSITLLCYFAMSLVLTVAIQLIERFVRRGHAFPQMPRS